MNFAWSESPHSRMSIGIAGGGISGLSFALKASRISSKSIRIYEKDSNLGGWIQTVRTNSGKGSFFLKISCFYCCSSNGENQTSKVQFLNVDQDQSDLPNRKKQDSVYHFSMNLDLKKILLPETKRIHRPNIGSYGNGSLKKCYCDSNFHNNIYKNWDTGLTI